MDRPKDQTKRRNDVKTKKQPPESNPFKPRRIDSFTVTEKICSCCKLLKLAEEFSINRNRRDGLQSRCRECCRIADRATRNPYWKGKIEKAPPKETEKARLEREATERNYLVYLSRRGEIDSEHWEFAQKLNNDWQQRLLKVGSKMYKPNERK